MPDFTSLLLDNAESNAERELSAALSALPLVGPKTNAWPALEAQLRQRGQIGPSRNHWRPTLAIAAALLLAVPLLRSLVPAPELPSGNASTTSTAVVPTKTQQAAAPTDWSARSQLLEADLRERTSDTAPLDATSAYAAAQLEDLIGMTDVALDQSRDPREADLLWQRRLLLMQRLGNVRSAGLIAVGPDSVAAVSDAAYRID